MSETDCARGEAVEYLRDQLIGPVGGRDERLRESPSQRYLLGVLYPREALAGVVLDADVVDEISAENGDEAGDDPLALTTQYMPSSVGLSFVVPAGTVLRVRPEAARYVEERKEWVRQVLVADPLEVREAVSGDLSRLPIWDGVAQITSVWREFGDSRLVTVALVNVKRAESERVDPSALLCQVGLEVRLESGAFRPYPTSDRTPRDSEEEEQALLYLHMPTFAIGHGCAADWEESVEAPSWVRTDFLPSEVVPGITFDIEGHDETRSLAFLSRISDEPGVVVERLRAFADAYGSWIHATAERQVPSRLASAKERLIGRMAAAQRRVTEGIDLLKDDGPAGSRARLAFGMANRAMALQMLHSGEQLGGTRRALSEAIDPGADQPETGPRPTWRPFQLAFLLLTLPSVTDTGHCDRGTVDLIWFPTGGGKTEAYLGLVAYQVFLRRLELGDDGAGTTVITRYTLRLLTTQQFQRTATLACAMEHIRRTDDERLGSEPITIGLWVGQSTTPNNFASAVETLDQMKRGDNPSVGFQLGACPWCGTDLLPDGLPDEAWGVVATNDGCRFRCPNPRCGFHSGLPVSVVDEDLYIRPPTILIATIDKFARMTWDRRAGVFLGAGGWRGPSLIIQDELHLISGPLGTVAALYEAAFDLVMERLSARPKVVASTATIRRAYQQVRGIFDRDVALFPPSGLSAEDSFFARVDRSAPGRRYLGVMAQSHTPTTGAVQAMAAILQAPVDLGFNDDDLDAYWTLVVYHNSLRELGKTVTLVRDDVPARIEVIAGRTDRRRRLDDDADLVELTSNVPSAQIPENLRLLGRAMSSSRAAVSVVACTNMLSVGVDVPRLSLMLMIGQPKTTSEYIQATSRVGRDPRRPPGLVVTLYSAAKPRDRSHYESFKPYHRSIYREVEATSVTPWALPARERALHAALVVLARHLLGLPDNDDAALFHPGPELEGLIAALVDRVGRADAAEREATEAHLRRLIDEWEALIGSARAGGLRYEAAGKGTTGLIRRFTQPGSGWPTLDSMRNVDFETLVKVSGERR